MIINPVAIATKGVYSNTRMVALPTFGYADLTAGEVAAITIGAYKGLYLGLYAKLYERR